MTGGVKREGGKKMWVPPQNERQKGSFEMMKMSLPTPEAKL